MTSISHRFLKDERGATAIEFAIICLPFFGFLFLIIEVALTFFAGAALDTSVKNAARDIRTGQAQTAGLSNDQMKTHICDALLNLFDCDRSLRLDVYTVGTMAAASEPEPKNNGGELFNLGDAGDYVVVRASLPWSFITGVLVSTGRESKKTGYLLSSATVFRNEPFHE